MLPPLKPSQSIERIVREEWGRILASLVKTLGGNFQLAEDALQDAVIVALDKWQTDGLPRSPAAWLITTAKRKALDRLRRDSNFASKQGEISYLLDLENEAHTKDEDHTIPDQRLEMIFTCCHPALDEKTSIALTLRTLGGLSTAEIASAFLDKPEAMAQRLVRARHKITKAGIPYQVPDTDALPERLTAVLRVLYLIFNEGYAAHSGDRVFRTDLSEEAIRLARIISTLMPKDTEIAGLLALMLLHDARRNARTQSDGTMIPLEHQNRNRWNRSAIKEGQAILHEAMAQKRIGPYQIQAAISALHNESPSWEQTDWPQIEALYTTLQAIEPSPVVQLNLAYSASHSRPLVQVLQLLDELETQLKTYQPFHAAKADILSRAGKTSEAIRSYEKAIALATNDRDAAFLRSKCDALVTRH
ncbi:RNA polymerase sigma factor [Pseudahrensia aquimaris]|uniref:RNA polymerase sigma factor n=1 Tax=Pseudahrensia aquimaris TaxID=744461 RepID=A0ABW3FJN3_9HYPH